MNTYLILGSVLLLFIILGYIRNKQAKKKVIHVIDSNCTGCQRCIKKCRHKALETVKDRTGLHVIVKYPEKCTACRDCIVVCKFNALELADRKQPQPVKVYV